jgi:hypothetical protein
MSKLRIVVTFTVLSSMQAFASDQRPIRVENYFEAIEFNRMTECVSDNKIYSIGMIIEKDSSKFVCNNFRHGTDFALDKNAPASWREKNNSN